MPTKEQKQAGWTLLMESLHKPDNKLRNCARNQECYDELLQYRDEVIEFCQTRLKEVQND